MVLRGSSDLPSSPRRPPFSVPLLAPELLTPSAPPPQQKANANFFRVNKVPSTAIDYYLITTQKAIVRIPGLIYPSGVAGTEMWGFNGQFPGPTIRAQAITTGNDELPNGRPAIVEVANALDIPTTIHLHGGHQGPDDDGHPNELILPPGRVAAAVANVVGAVSRSAAASLLANRKQYNYQNEPNTRQGCTLWYHDHTESVTGENVFRGLAGFYILADDHEAELARMKLLPTGLASRVPGPEHHEIPLLIQDKRFDATGQLIYRFDKEGVLGDTILVNGSVQPYFQVATRRYRFRLLNGSNARVYTLALSVLGSASVPRLSFTQIGSEGGLLPFAVVRDTVEIAPAERLDVIVDFSKLPVGSQVVLQNLAREVPGLEDDDAQRLSTAQIMRFDVARAEVDDVQSIPDGYALLPDFFKGPDVFQNRDLRSLASSIPTSQRRTFEFDDSDGWTINERGYAGPCSGHERFDALVTEGTTELWTLVNTSGGWVHPVHIHENEWQIVSRNGRPPRPWELGWKDTFLLREERVQVITHFLPERRDPPEFRGTYVFHCHNLEHEDRMMMSQFSVVAPGKGPIPSPVNGCEALRRPMRGA
jgi:FtsP/CotA-like multicopper oxidase with cupredoxin domain